MPRLDESIEPDYSRAGEEPVSEEYMASLKRTLAIMRRWPTVPGSEREKQEQAQKKPDAA